MRKYEENGIRVLEPAEGKYLTNGETYSTRVYLGKDAPESGWTEVDELPTPEPEDEAGGEGAE